MVIVARVVLAQKIYNKSPSFSLSSSTAPLAGLMIEGSLLRVAVELEGEVALGEAVDVTEGPAFTDAAVFDGGRSWAVAEGSLPSRTR